MSSSNNQSDGFAMAVVVEGGLAILALLLAWLFRVQLKDLFPPLGSELLAAVARGILATAPMLIIFWILVNSSWPALRQLREQVQWLISEIFPSRSIGQFAMVATLAGVGEELLFRGAIQTRIALWTTPLIGILITSFFFGLAHALSKVYFIFGVAVGGFLGWLAWRYNDLAAPMVAHGLYDFLALVYLSRSVNRGAKSENVSDSRSFQTSESPRHNEPKR